MSVAKRILIYCLTGLVAGMAAWPVIEIVILNQVNFPSYLIFSLTVGMVFGFMMGGFFGSTDKLHTSQFKKILSGMLHGAVIGALGGIVGFLIGQALLFFIREYIIHSMQGLHTVALPLSRAIGWAVMGVFIGMIDGIRSFSFDKIKVGILGGATGGFIGGIILEYLILTLPQFLFTRMICLMILGLFISLFYGLIEKRLSAGILGLLNGKHKGNDFLLNQRKITIGASDKNDIVLSRYINVSDVQAELRIKKHEVLVKSCDEKNPVYVNDDKVNEHILKFEDVLRIGSAKLMYKPNSY